MTTVLLAQWFLCTAKYKMTVKRPKKICQVKRPKKLFLKTSFYAIIFSILHLRKCKFLVVKEKAI